MLLTPPPAAHGVGRHTAVRVPVQYSNLLLYIIVLDYTAHRKLIVVECILWTTEEEQRVGYKVN